MAGYFHNGTCYALQSQATDAYFQSIQPSFQTINNNTLQTYYLRHSNGTWLYVKDTTSNAGLTTNLFAVPAYQPTFSTCQQPNDKTSNFLEGMELGWAVASVMVIVFVIRRTYRGF